MAVPDGVEDRIPNVVFQANLWAIQRQIQSVLTGVDSGVIITESEHHVLAEMLDGIETDFGVMRKKLSVRVRK